MQLNNFKKNIPKLNSAFNFASLTANIFWISGHHIFCRVLTLHSEQGFIPPFNNFHIFQQYVLQQQMAQQKDANCHEDVILQIQNIHLNPFALDENTLQMETKVIERTAQEERLFLF